MTNEQAILAVVIHRPGDDLPRLVFADWLDENGKGHLSATVRDAVRVEWCSAPWGPLTFTDATGRFANFYLPNPNKRHFVVFL